MKEVELTQGYVALVDDEDFERVSAIKWQASWGSAGKGKVYATSWLGPRKARKRIRLHRFVMNVGFASEDPRVVHHKNGETLDCRKTNLAIVSQYVNMAYAGIIAGVTPPGPLDPFELCGECGGRTEAKEVFICGTCRAEVFSFA